MYLSLRFLLVLTLRKKREEMELCRVVIMGRVRMERVEIPQTRPLQNKINPLLNLNPKSVLKTKGLKII